MQWNRHQYLDLMTHRPVPRPMFVELFGPLVGLEAEWRAQGGGEDELNLVAFDFDYLDRIDLGARTGPIGMESVTLDETDEQRIFRDHLGRTCQLLKKTATIGLPIDFPVRTMDDWLGLKPMYQFSDARIDWQQVARAKAARESGALTHAGIPGAYDTGRELMGEEELSIAFYEQPELVHDIVNTITETSVQVLERISREVVIDQLSVHEDFAGRSGPLIGPVQIREYLLPHYQRVWQMLRQRGSSLFQLDTDGNINIVIDDLLDCGLTNIYPMEPAAGMDIVQVRNRYGERLGMSGGIDKHVLRQGKAEIRRELEYKLLAPGMKTGIAFGLDHRIPNGTPLDHYRYYVQTAREILGIPPPQPGAGGWMRMAF